MNLEEIKELKHLLATPKKIVIIPHRNPDGDAYGSCLAMYHYLKNTGHSVTVISPNDAPEFLKWLPAVNDIIIYEESAKKAKDLLRAAELIFTLDFNALHRVGDDMERKLRYLKCKYIMVDHHEQPDDYAAIMYSDPSMSSTCEMVYHLLEKLDALDQINKEIATCIYTGILTDTGSFRFPSTTAVTMKIVADLMSRGVDHTRVYNNIFDTNSYNRLQLLGKSLSNLKMIEDCKTAYITLSQEEMSAYKFKKGDTEGFVNYGLSLKGIVFAIIFIEDQKQGIIKMSFRSKGKFSVNDFARKHFNGGGHENAAGGRSTENLETTVANFLSILPQYKQQLQESYEE